MKLCSHLILSLMMWVIVYTYCTGYVGENIPIHKNNIGTNVFVHNTLSHWVALVQAKFFISIVNFVYSKRSA